MMYAFARDGGIPGHSFFAKVSTNWKSPIRTGTWLQCAYYGGATFLTSIYQ